MVEACGSLSHSMTAQELHSQDSFPLFTMDSWEVHAGEARKRGGIESFTFLPWLIGPEEVQSFNAYSRIASAGWQNESIETYKTYHPSDAHLSYATSSNPMIYGFPSRKPTIGAPGETVLPFWTLSPPSRRNFNVMLMNMYPFFNAIVSEAISTRGKRTCPASGYKLTILNQILIK